MPLVKTYPAKELKNKIGSVLSVASREPVAITRNGHFSYVILSAEDWENIQGEQLYAQQKATLLKQQAKEVRPKSKKKDWGDSPLFGMWSDRKDMEDVETYIRHLRKPRFTI